MKGIQSRLTNRLLPQCRNRPCPHLFGIQIGALVEWLQEHIAFGQESTNNLASFTTKTMQDFGMSAWISQSYKKVISRSVTSCAGMTAFMLVIVKRHPACWKRKPCTIESRAKKPNSIQNKVCLSQGRKLFERWCVSIGGAEWVQ